MYNSDWITDCSVFFPQFLVYFASKVSELKALRIMCKRDTESVLSNGGNLEGTHLTREGSLRVRSLPGGISECGCLRTLSPYTLKVHLPRPNSARTADFVDRNICRTNSNRGLNRVGGTAVLASPPVSVETRHA